MLTFVSSVDWFRVLGIAVATFIATSACSNSTLATGGPTVDYYPPGRYSEAPTWIIAELKNKKCLIPQASYFDPLPHNLIRGEFVTKGHFDWAVLCSRNNKSSILLLSKSKQVCSQELLSVDDSNYIQQVAQNRFRFSRMIDPISKKDLIRYAKQNKNQSALKETKFDHDGIVNKFLEKSSSVFYCDNGKWIKILRSY